MTRLAAASGLLRTLRPFGPCGGNRGGLRPHLLGGPGLERGSRGPCGLVEIGVLNARAELPLRLRGVVQVGQEPARRDRTVSSRACLASVVMAMSADP